MERSVRYLGVLARALLLLLAMQSPASAWERFEFQIAGNDGSLETSLKSASLLRNLPLADRGDVRSVVGAALSDYGRLLETLYGEGHYGGTIRIALDGREAASISVFDLPKSIASVSIRVDPGPAFGFGAVEIGPLAEGTTLPTDLRSGARAKSVLIQQGLDAAFQAWRMAGHAKPTLLAQSVTADHGNRTLSVQLRLDPGPKVRFGQLQVTTPSAVRVEHINQIAGLPSGAVFSPEVVDSVASRLRRTGAFRSVAVSEAEKLGPDATMDIGLALADEEPRRFGFGAELSSTDGLMVSGYWLHRNLFGGAERFRFDAEVANIDPQGAGTDYRLGARLDVPAVFGPDTRAIAYGEIEHINDPAYRSTQGALGLGMARIFSDRLDAEIGVALRNSRISDALGTRSLSLIAAPARVSWDRRDDPLDPAQGFFVEAKAEPFVGLSGAGSGLWAHADTRIYHGLGQNDQLVLAGRAQLGTTVGPDTDRLHPDYLFFSGGGGTVRGHTYQSLGVDLGSYTVGGKAFLGLSAELRLKLSERIGGVAFVDAGHIGAQRLFDGGGGWHAGAGIGMRYMTGIGPIRLDVALPISGPATGGQVQLYLGIGQAF